MSTSPTTRFVSLYGFYAFAYPEGWINETDETGNYVFYNPNGGSGIIRILTQINEDKSEGNASRNLEQVLQNQHEYDAKRFTAGVNEGVSFVQIHEVNGKEFTLSCYVLTVEDKIVLFTYLVDSEMKTLPTSHAEKEDLMRLLASVEFMPADHHHHH